MFTAAWCVVCCKHAKSGCHVCNYRNCCQTSANIIANACAIDLPTSTVPHLKNSLLNLQMPGTQQTVDSLQQSYSYKVPAGNMATLTNFLKFAKNY